VRSTNVEDEDLLELSQFHDLDTIRRQELTDTARRLATRVRLELVLTAVCVNSTRPRLKRNLRALSARCGGTTATRKPDTFLPWSREDRAPVRIARRRAGRGPGLTPAASLWVRGRATTSIRDANLHTRTLRRRLLLLLTAERFGQYGRQEQRRGPTQRKAMSHKKPQ
jgi:hypothetical protein